jgi:hypothetical protein
VRGFARSLRRCPVFFCRVSPRVPSATCRETSAPRRASREGLRPEIGGLTEAGFLVGGVRTPGSPVPQLALVARGRLVWKVVVPSSDRLEAAWHGIVVVSRGIAITAWQKSGVIAGYVSGFSLQTGDRLWDARVPSVGRLTPLEGIVLVESKSGSDVRALDLKDGTERYRLPPEPL